MHDIANQYPAARQVAFIELGPAPNPGPAQILIRTHYSGITNGTERHQTFRTPGGISLIIMRTAFTGGPCAKRVRP